MEPFEDVEPMSWEELAKRLQAEKIAQHDEIERLRGLLDELHASVKDKLGSMNHCFGPNARTAVSGESVKAYNRIVAALDAADPERRKGPHA